MDSSYNRWLEKEMAWIKQERKQANGRAALLGVAIAVAMPLISLIFGYTSGEPDFWRGAPASLLIGACIGFITWISVFLSRATVRYEKNIKSSLESMTQSDRENMARQMLGEDPEVKEREVSWKGILEGHSTVPESLADNPQGKLITGLNKVVGSSNDMPCFKSQHGE